jgi:predicted SprT family Zn-dependent metalloprotease
MSDLHIPHQRLRLKAQPRVPWQCPACSTRIGHSEAEPQPRPGRIYRCNVCRLELVMDESTNRLIVAPLTTDGARPEPI